MKSVSSIFITGSRRIFLFLPVLLSLLVQPLASASQDSVSVTVTGIHHMAADYRIDNFYLNKGAVANVGPGGGGGGYVCCIVLPRLWRQDLTVDVRWSVADWSNPNIEEIKKGNWASVRGEGIYQAQVPIEKYIEPPSELYVHFFSGGKARVLTDTALAPIIERPGRKEASPTRALATQGKLRDGYFSKDELRAMEEESRLRRKKYGDWR